LVDNGGPFLRALPAPADDDLQAMTGLALASDEVAVAALRELTLGKR
jgi:hypothetical protein